MKRALFVWGGWDGHTPRECAERFAPWLETQGFDVTVATSLDVYTDAELMGALDLIVPIWTMGEISREQVAAVSDAVANGTGIAGSTIYSTHHPCSVCAKMIINAGIRTIYYLSGYADSM